ncbi:oxidoreductase [Arthrobacter sp. QXT-31]|uniref:oxidoreductase n=1 Tax=Arthrobacter sp. QXT-31 TaxID=1357915 RepID=UPI00097188CF|nr:oxidoreductase [Arthrobacter sp. QXT-31]APX04322.1 short-chain dehydrogenase/reductase [Arthrobacter sp. QXT-31]
MDKKVALVTGGSSGIGEVAARQLKDAGFTVYAAARRADRMAALEQAGIRTLSLDVTDDASARAAVERIITDEGRIDVLVNNAGYGSYGSLEEAPLAEAQAQLDVNVLGLARLTQLVVPHMRTQKSGTIINISSMGGRFATPLGAWYNASKYAVEGLSDALRLELAQFGIDVVVIQAGGTRSEWGAIAAGKLRATSGHGPYRVQAEAMSKTLSASSEPGYRLASPPEVVGRAIVKAATARKPRTRYSVGIGATPLIWLSRTLPDRTFDSLIKRFAGVRA